MTLWLLLACTSDGETSPGPSGGDGPEASADTSPGDTGAAVHTGPVPTGQATITTRDDLSPWLGFEVVLDGAETASLTCTSDVEMGEVHRLEVGPGSHSLPGLLADHPYTCALHAGSHTLWSEGARTPALPAFLPALVVTSGEGSEVADGWLVLNQWDGGDVQRALILDGKGRIRWHADLDADAAGTNVQWAPPYLLAGGGHTQAPVALDLDGVEHFRAPALPEGSRWHHECRQVEVDGTYGVLGLSSTPLPLEHRTTEEDQYGFAIDVFDPADGTLLWSWDVVDHLDQWPALGTDDPWHVNAVTWEDDGHSWVSARALDQIRRLDRGTGLVTHTLGRGGDVLLFDADGQPLTDDDWFLGQHSPSQHSDRLFVLDNGRPLRPRSRVVEYRLDLDAHAVTQVWSWTEPGWFDPYYGSVDLLPASGHVLLGVGHCTRCEGSGGISRSAFVAEIDQATDEVVWRLDFVDPNASMYRAQFVPHDGLFHHVVE